MPVTYRLKSPLARYVTLTSDTCGDIAVSAPAWMWKEAGESVSTWFRDDETQTRTLSAPSAETLLSRMAVSLMSRHIQNIVTRQRGCCRADLVCCGWPLEVVARLGPQASRAAAKSRPDLVRDLYAA